MCLLLAFSLGCASIHGCRRAAEAPLAGKPSPEPPVPASSPVAPSDEEIEAAITATEEPRTSAERLATPPELQLYADRKRFLAIQAAAAWTEAYTRPHDLASLARLIRAGEMQPLPVLGEHYVLDGVGEDVHEDPLHHYDVEANLDVPLVADPAAAESAAAELERTGRPRDAERARLTRKLFGDPSSRAMLIEEYQAITALAHDFEGESYDLRDEADREAFQSRMLSSLRPAAREVMLTLADAYHARFGRRLPVVSMVRTQRYQRLLSRVNANATDIGVPPHTTGQAFDITYRSMATDEQNFLMTEIAKLEDEGRVEALRENRNCFHVFAFGTAKRPDEPAIAAARAVIVADREEEEPVKKVRRPRRARASTRSARRR
jgi:hypothetical protein